jgi:hypothetical protein
LRRVRGSNPFDILGEVVTSALNTITNEGLYDGRKKSEDTKNKIRKWSKENPRGFIVETTMKGVKISAENRIKKSRERYSQNIKYCAICSEEIQYLKRSRATCGKQECRSLHLSNSLKGKSGGYRENATGFGKGGWYKGYFCNSTWELAFIIYCLDADMKVERNLQSWTYYDPQRDGTFKYFPDFRVNGKLVEIKGRKTYVDQLKIQAVDEPIVLLYREDLKEFFDNVKDVYGKGMTTLIDLYDQSNIQNKICPVCDAVFLVTRTRKIVCSPICGGKWRSNRFREASRTGDHPVLMP